MHTRTLKLVALKPGLNQHGRGDILVGEGFEASPQAAETLIARGVAEVAKPAIQRRKVAPPVAPKKPERAREPAPDKPDTEVTEGGE